MWRRTNVERAQAGQSRLTNSAEQAAAEQPRNSDSLVRKLAELDLRGLSQMLVWFTQGRPPR